MRGGRAELGVRRWTRAITLRTLALFALALVASLAFVILAAEVRTGALDDLDATIALAVHRLDAPALDIVMKIATTIGANVVLLPVAGLVTLLAIRRRERRVAIVLVLNTIVVLAVVAVLKVAFSRERPRLFDKIAVPTDYSFPSGHAMQAMGVYGVIAAVLIALHPALRRPLIVAAALIIATVGFSRIYLGVHWPFDVLGGYLGGVPPLVASIHLIHRRAARDRNLADVV